MKQKLDPEIFREAVSSSEGYEHLYCCNAIRRVAGGWGEDKQPYQDFFAKWFKPEGPIENEFSSGWWGTSELLENRKAREIALLLCADILERQNKKK